MGIDTGCQFSNLLVFRIEFEQNLAANEQTGPINREMRHLITSLQNHNQQLKGEVSRYKRKLKEAQNELAKVKNGGGEEKGSGECASTSSATSEDENKKDDGLNGGDKAKGRMKRSSHAPGGRGISVFYGDEKRYSI